LRKQDYEHIVAVDCIFYQFFHPFVLLLENQFQEVLLQLQKRGVLALLVDDSEDEAHDRVQVPCRRGLESEKRQQFLSQLVALAHDELKPVLVVDHCVPYQIEYVFEGSHVCLLHHPHQLPGQLLRRLLLRFVIQIAENIAGVILFFSVGVLLGQILEEMVFILSLVNDHDSMWRLCKFRYFFEFFKSERARVMNIHDFFFRFNGHAIFLVLFVPLHHFDPFFCKHAMYLFPPDLLPEGFYLFGMIAHQTSLAYYYSLYFC
jgi:hypothetical protein